MKTPRESYQCRKETFGGHATITNADADFLRKETGCNKHSKGQRASARNGSLFHLRETHRDFPGPEKSPTNGSTLCCGPVNPGWK